jgi:hypothetical protein
MQIFGTALAGLQSAEIRLDQTAARLARVADPSDTGDLATDMVDLMLAKQEHAANCQSIKVADEMWQHTIDLIA